MRGMRAQPWMLSVVFLCIVNLDFKTLLALSGRGIISPPSLSFKKNTPYLMLR